MEETSDSDSLVPAKNTLSPYHRRLLANNQMLHLKNVARELILNIDDLSDAAITSVVTELYRIIVEDFNIPQYKKTAVYSIVHKVLKGMTVDACRNPKLIESINKKVTIRRVDTIYKKAIESGKLSDALAALKFRSELTGIGGKPAEQEQKKKNTGKKAPSVQVGPNLVIGHSIGGQDNLRTLPMEVLEKLANGESSKLPAKVIEVSDVPKILEQND
jgi:hypothetical protein